MDSNGFILILSSSLGRDCHGAIFRGSFLGRIFIRPPRFRPSAEGDAAMALVKSRMMPVFQAKGIDCPGIEIER
jgi:hypothetical protein